MVLAKGMMQIAFVSLVCTVQSMEKVTHTMSKTDPCISKGMKRTGNSLLTCNSRENEKENSTREDCTAERSPRLPGHAILAVKTT